MGVQVTELTRNKSCYEKEFIDFEFDGKHISEFGMVAVADGGRHSFDAAPTFQDETSSVNGVDGQYYWGTHFGSKKMTFSLATDGMTEAQINAFKLHFRPGKYGRFIEDKLSCRKAYARVAQIATFNMVPFRVKKTINKTSFYINEYKGDCRIAFEFDNPYFETVSNLVEDINDEQSIRAIYINNTPWKGSWEKSTQCFIGDNIYLLKQGAAMELNKSDLTKNEIVYYNPATAKTKAKIILTVQPHFTTSFPIYFDNFYDDINHKDKPPYNKILTTDSFELKELNNIQNSSYTHEFRFTSPDVIYSINKAIKMANEYTGLVASEFEEQLRLEIVNNKVMGWAASALRYICGKYDIYYDKNTGNFLDKTLEVNCSYIKNNETSVLGLTENLTWKQYFNIFMLYMIAEHKVIDPSGTMSENDKLKLVDISDEKVQWEFDPYSICFDGEKNYTSMTYSYNQLLSNLEKVSGVEESCGDMILSEYLNLDGGDVLKEDKIATIHKLKLVYSDGGNCDIINMSLYYTPTYF